MEQKNQLDELKTRVDKIESELASVKKELSNLLLESDDSKVKKPTLEPPSQQVSSKPIPKPEIPQKPFWLKENFELFLGGNLLGKLGLVAIILACAWFIKFAFDNHWINESSRIYIGLCIGFFVSGVSLILAKKNFRILPGAVMGSGASIVYISILSAYYYYDLLGLSETYVVIALLSIGIGILASISRLQLLYIFSFLGSILTPILLSQGENSYRFLFGYMLVVNAVFLLVSYSNAWRMSPYIVLFTNAILFDVWAAANIKVSSFFVPFLFLTTTFFFFITREVVFMVRLRKQVITSSLLFVFFTTLFYTTSGFWLVDTFYPNLTPHFFLWVASLTLVASEIFHKKGIFHLPQSSNSKILMDSILLICWVSAFFASITDFTEGKWLTMSWISFAGAVSIVGSKQASKKILLIGSLLWIPALFRLYFLESGEHYGETFLWNYRFALFVVSSLFLIYTYYIQYKKLVHPFAKGFAFIALFTIILGTLIENRYLVVDKYYRNLGYSYVLVFYIVALLLPGFIFNSKTLRVSGIVVSSILVLKLYFYDIWTMSILVRIIAGFSLGVGLVVMSIVFQKYRDKLTKIIHSILVFGIIGTSLVATEEAWAVPFKNKGFKFYKNVEINKAQLKNKGEKFGKIILDEDIMRFSGNNDRRLVYNGHLVPFFTREVITEKGESGEVSPTVIYETSTDYSKTYVLKFPSLPSDSEYTKLKVASSKNYDINVSLSLGDKPDEWKYFEDYHLYNYGGDAANNKDEIEFKNGNFLYARLQFDSKINSLSFPRATYSPKKLIKEYKVELDKTEFVESFDADIDATLYYYENSLHKPIKKLVLVFEDSWYDRNLEVYQKNSNKDEFQYLKNQRLYKTSKDKPKQVINLDYSIYGKIKVRIMNGDNEPLKLKSFDAFTPQEEIIFDIPTQYQEAKQGEFQLYYGNIYAYFPKFDFQESRLTGRDVSWIEGSLGKHAENPNFGYSIVEPPLSIWIIRAIYMLGILAFVYPSYRVFKRYSENMNTN
ncbi:MAG: DUF2339 domain-containing protein [Leptospiraceae bacterium]|nr:DUF2339 domain-containing protein [Leptospiraceae bacterium]